PRRHDADGASAAGPHERLPRVEPRPRGGRPDLLRVHRVQPERPLPRLRRQRGLPEHHRGHARDVSESGRDPGRGLPELARRLLRARREVREAHGTKGRGSEPVRGSRRVPGARRGAGAALRGSARTATRSMTRTGTSKLSIAALLLAACASAQGADTLRATAQRLFGSIPPVQAEEIRAPIVELGRALFWDERLSSSGSIACASCHPATAAGADDRRFSIDARGRPTARNAQTVFNSQAASAGLRWTADRPSGAAQAVGSITGSLGFDSAADIVPVLDRSGY